MDCLGTSGFEKRQHGKFSWVSFYLPHTPTLGAKEACNPKPPPPIHTHTHTPLRREKPNRDLVWGTKLAQQPKPHRVMPIACSSKALSCLSSHSRIETPAGSLICLQQQQQQSPISPYSPPSGIRTASPSPRRSPSKNKQLREAPSAPADSSSKD